jgi:hypothetical protein
MCGDSLRRKSPFGDLSFSLSKFCSSALLPKNATSPNDLGWLGTQDSRRWQTKVGSDAEDIRSFRQELIQSGDPGFYASILESEDFFSISACRDLLFHVQEQRMTLAQIAGFIQSHNLSLLGFELDERVLAAYRKRFPQDRAATDLACWAAFEADHPSLFGGMYIFWLQKLSGGTGPNLL